LISTTYKNTGDAGHSKKQQARQKNRVFSPVGSQFAPFYLKCFPLAENVIRTSFDKGWIGHHV